MGVCGEGGGEEIDRGGRGGREKWDRWERRAKKGGGM